MIAVNLEGVPANQATLSMSAGYAIRPGWLDSSALALLPGEYSPAETLVEIPDDTPIEDFKPFTTPPRFVLTPPTPQSSPRVSIRRRDSDVTPSLSFPSRRSRRPHTEPVQGPDNAPWANVFRPRVSRTKTVPIPPPLAGHTRSASTSSSTSVSTLSSSRAKPPPVNSILHRSSSISTKNSTAAKSVKFVERPTVFDYACDETLEPPPAAKLPPERPGKFSLLKRLLRRSNPRPTPPAVQQRPAISGPYRLCSAPGLASIRGSETSLHSANASVRSNRNPGSKKVRRALGRMTCMVP